MWEVDVGYATTVTVLMGTQSRRCRAARSAVAPAGNWRQTKSGVVLILLRTDPPRERALGDAKHRARRYPTHRDRRRCLVSWSSLAAVGRRRRTERPRDLCVHLLEVEVLAAVPDDDLLLLGIELEVATPSF